MTMMKMTAMESLKDPHMLYLDIASGLGGLVLYNLVENGKASFKFSNINWKLALVVLISRIIIDFSYSKLISDTDSFGGSNSEFIYSSLLFFAIIFGLFKLGMNKSITLYVSTALVMFAVARVTHWG